MTQAAHDARKHAQDRQTPRRGGAWALVALFVALAAILMVPGAAAEQNTWEFGIESGGFSGIALATASQTFPSDTVPKGATFYAYASITVDYESLDVAGDGVQAVGCTVMDTDVSPGSDSVSWRQATLEIRMDGDTCSVRHSMQIVNGGSVLRNQTFAFTVASYQMLDLGSDPSEAGFAYWLPILLFAAIFVWGGYTHQLALVVVGVLGIVGENLIVGDVSRLFLIFVALIAATFPALAAWWRHWKEKRSAKK